MDIKLKKLNDQVIVVTGASSGIGLTTVEMAAERGARVVLAARSGAELEADGVIVNLGSEVSDRATPPLIVVGGVRGCSSRWPPSRRG